MTFEQWKSEVDRIFVAEFGMNCDDMEDYNYIGDYNDGYTPRECYRAFCDDYDML